MWLGQDGHGSAPLSKKAGTLSHHVLAFNALLHGCLDTSGLLKHTLIFKWILKKKKSNIQTAFNASIDN